ncbi:hypothetical protein SLS62_006246 [Diatrype stigma]|uniref:Beta-glucosidase cel3A n=1 Tax=Diatrype stigma TaxID=117547 RepID=A0AAN9YP68_9PEZI
MLFIWSYLLVLLPGVRLVLCKSDTGKENVQVRLSKADGAAPSLDWNSAVTKAKAFTSQLEFDEKIAMVTGNSATNLQGCVGNIDPIPRVDFEGLCYSDGPQAFNRADGVSIFPSGVTAGATWDKDLIFQRGVALAEEFKAKGVHVMLGPVSGPLGRNPLGGRNWEGFSPDPYLAGQAMKATIHGAQSIGVQTSSKHYIGNEQETQRSQGKASDGSIVEAVSSNIDDRTLHELYLWPFADAIRAGTTSVMCSYNRVNGTYACSNKYLLTEILRDELGFQGYVVSDWWATHGTAEYANGGLDLEMPGVQIPEWPTYFGANLSAAIQAGEVSEARLDEMVTAVMTPYYLLEQDSPDYPKLDSSLAYVKPIHDAGWANLPPSLQNSTPPVGLDVRGNHASLIRKIAAAGTVLLKNEENILPLKDQTLRNIGVFGNDAGAPTDGLVYDGSTGSEYGTVDIGGGSGTGRHMSLVTPLEAIKQRSSTVGARVQHILSNKVIAANDFRSIYPIPDICLVFTKSWATEGLDRVSFEADWNSTAVVNNVAGLCNQTVVITHSGNINTMPWANHPNVKAILAAHLPGEESGNSLVDVLWGDVEPSGRLPYTIPKVAADYDIPITNRTGEDVGRYGWQANFTEGLNIDYRHFDSLDTEPLYEFGFGLSYTSFELSGGTTFAKSTPNETLYEVPDPSLIIMPGGNPDLWKTILTGQTTIKNTGSRPGATVLQLYVSFPVHSVPDGTPRRVLRGFEKVFLEPGEERVVMFPLMRRDLSYWNIERRVWQIPEGEFILSIGFSSRDLRDTVGLEVL